MDDRVPNNMRQKVTELKEIDKSTVTFAVTFSVINRIVSRQKIYEGVEDPSSTINLTQLTFIDHSSQQ